jgi:hypothetical protein
LQGQGQGFQRDAAGDERERGADPGEEGAFVGQGEPRVRLGADLVDPAREAGVGHGVGVDSSLRTSMVPDSGRSSTEVPKLPVS